MSDERAIALDADVDEDFDVVEFHFTGRDADPTRRDFLRVLGAGLVIAVAAGRARSQDQRGGRRGGEGAAAGVRHARGPTAHRPGRHDHRADRQGRVRPGRPGRAHGRRRRGAARAGRRRPPRHGRHGARPRRRRHVREPLDPVDRPGDPEGLRRRARPAREDGRPPLGRRPQDGRGPRRQGRRTPRVARSPTAISRPTPPPPRRSRRRPLPRSS